jgi:hypothetical protein
VSDFVTELADLFAAFILQLKQPTLHGKKIPEAMLQSYQST